MVITPTAEAEVEKGTAGLSSVEIGLNTAP